MDHKPCLGIEIEYISKDLALKRFEEIKNSCVSLKDFVYLDGVMAVLDCVPVADVAPVVHGRWEVEEEDWGFCEETGDRHIHKKFKCSVCGYTTGDQAEKFVCCPICTAKMDR